MASLKYLDPITGEYKKVASGGGGTSIPASDTEPASGNYWLDTSEEGGTYYTAGEVDNMLAALPKGVQMDLLWENPDPTVNFDAQTISLDFSGYDDVCVKALNSTSGDTLIDARTEVGKSGVLVKIASSSSEGWYIMLQTRAFTVRDTSIQFGITEYGRDGGYVNDRTDLIIPYKIYGIKGVQ